MFPETLGNFWWNPFHFILKSSKDTVCWKNVPVQLFGATLCVFFCYAGVIATGFKYIASRKKWYPWIFCNNFVKFWPLLIGRNVRLLIFNRILCRLLATPIIYAITVPCKIYYTTLHFHYYCNDKSNSRPSVGTECVLAVRADDCQCAQSVTAKFSVKVFSINTYLLTYFLYGHLLLTSLIRLGCRGAIV